MVRQMIYGLIVAAGVATLGCSSEKIAGPGPGRGILSARLMDAPPVLDSVAEVNVFVVRIDARRKEVESDMELEANLDRDHGAGEHEGEHADSSEWVTIAAPNRAFDLLTLQGGVTAFLGETPVDTGRFRAIRLIIDPMQSTIVLKDGTVLSATSDPPVEFESRGRHAVLAEFDDSVEVHEGKTTTLVLDIRLASSISLRGRTIRDGFVFRPTVVGHSEHEH